MRVCRTHPQMILRSARAYGGFMRIWAARSFWIPGRGVQRSCPLKRRLCRGLRGGKHRRGNTRAPALPGSYGARGPCRRRCCRPPAAADFWFRCRLQMYYRRDVLAAHGLSPPVTWEAFLDVAARVNGTDMDGDGQPDFGVCLQRPRCGSSSPAGVASSGDTVTARVRELIEHGGVVGSRERRRGRAHGQGCRSSG